MNEQTPQQSIPAEELQHAWQQSLTEILGEAIEGEDFTQASLLKFTTNIKEKYGAQAANGLTLRLGRSLARNLLPQICANTNPTERLAPRQQKILKTAQQIAKALSFLHKNPSEITSQSSSLEVKLPTTVPEIVAFWAGIFQETAYWANGGHLHPIFTDSENGVKVLRLPL